MASAYPQSIKEDTQKSVYTFPFIFWVAGAMVSCVMCLFWKPIHYETFFFLFLNIDMFYNLRKKHMEVQISLNSYLADNDLYR